jgi:hypothetical protein
MLRSFALTTVPALAWDNLGYMEVAAVAWSKLTPTARAAELLKISPMYNVLTRNTSAGQRDQVAFVRAATWPDAIKSARGYSPGGSSGGDRPPLEPKASQSIGYSDHFSTSTGTSTTSRSRPTGPLSFSRAGRLDRMKEMGS